MEKAIAAECEVIESVVHNHGKLYANRDDNLVRDYTYPDELEIIKYGISDSEDLDATIQINEMNIQGTSFLFMYGNMKLSLETDLFGEHYLTNLCGVLACCTDLGMEKEKIAHHVQQLRQRQKTFHLHES